MSSPAAEVITNLLNSQEFGQKLQELEGRLLIRFNIYEKMISELNEKDQKREEQNSLMKAYINKLEEQLKAMKCRVKKLQVCHIKCCKDIKEIEAELIQSQENSQSKVISDCFHLQRRQSQKSAHSDHCQAIEQEDCMNTCEILSQIVEASHKQRNITFLNLSENKLSLNQIKFLEKHDWSHIIQLNLSQTHLDDECLEVISKTNWDNLEHLHLALNCITDGGIEHLLKMNLPKLKTLNLYGNQITESGIQRICNHSWETLEKIYVQNNDISEIQAVNFNRMSRRNSHEGEIQIKI